MGRNIFIEVMTFYFFIFLVCFLTLSVLSGHLVSLVVM